MPDLERALQIAVKFHEGQKDKNGAPYVFHPIRVMMRCTDPTAKIAALLHDVVEDSHLEMADLLAEGFSQEVLDVVSLLTHDPAVSYEDYVEAIARHPLAVQVKLADLEDNSDVRRLREVNEKTLERFKKYLTAYIRLSRYHHHDSKC